MNTSKSPKQSPSKKSPRKSPTKTKKKPDVDIPPPIEDTTKFFEAGAEAFGFSDSNCHNCGIHTSEIGGFLMQCAKCKKAYYCGMKCFNEHLPKHQAYCQTAGLDKEPEKKMWEPVSPKEVKKVTLQVEEIDNNLYKLVASDGDDKPLKIKALDAAGSHLRGLEPGCLFRYTRAGTGQDSREQIQKDPEHGCVHELFGKGDLKITASNEAGQKATAKVHPAEPAAPHLKVVVVDKEKRIYRVKYDNESAELEVANRGGHLYGTLEPNALFCYRSNEIPGERAGPDGVQILSGEDDLMLTATNAAGKKTKVKVSPTDGLAPLLDIEDLGGGVHRIVASDPDGGNVVISAVDSNGHPFASSNLVSGSIFQYRDAGNGPSKDSEITDSTHGHIPMLIGHGDLSVKATNEEKKTTEAIVKPSEASPPKLEIEDLGNGLRKVVATDESGTPVRLAAVDINGKPFTLKPGSIFSYTDAGEGPSKQKESQDQACGSYQKLHGHGELSITATNESGKTSKVTVDPSDASPPKLEIEDLGNGLHKVVATDDTGDPVSLRVVDGKGRTFSLEPDTIFSYIEAGNGPAKQHQITDPSQGQIQKILGNKTLTITATNSAGKSAKADVVPVEASPPELTVEEVKRGLFRVDASDESGEPVDVTYTDSQGNAFDPPGSLFYCTDSGEAPARKSEKDGPGGESVPSIFAKGNLTVTATNTAGKKTSVAVQPANASPPTLRVEEVEPGLYLLKAEDEDSTDPVEIAAEDSGGNSFTSSLRPGALFRYIEAGDGACRQIELDDPDKHGKFQKLHGHGDLTITAKNAAGKTACATVHPEEASSPALVLEEIEDGMFKIVASDDNDEPLRIEAEDNLGNKFGSDFVPGSLFRYTEDDEQKDTVDDDENHGRVRNLRGPAPELWIYCYNEAGKQSKKKVKAKKRAQKEKKPRDGHDWDNEDFTLKPSDYKPKRKEERVLTKEVTDKLIFWYGRLGHPNQATMRRLVATKLPPSAGITVEDVDLLPWIIRGTMLNTQKLHEVIAEMDVLEKGSYQPREGYEDSDDDR